MSRTGRNIAERANFWANVNDENVTKNKTDGAKIGEYHRFILYPVLSVSMQNNRSLLLIRRSMLVVGARGRLRVHETCGLS